MPLAVGFHPYFRFPGIPRDRWVLRIPARKTVMTDNRQIPTGVFKAMDLPNPLPLGERTMDHGFTDLERDSAGHALFFIQAGEQRIEVILGAKYLAAGVWGFASYPGQTDNFICVEPMTSIANGMNLNHAGKYSELQTVPPGGKWTESFWIRRPLFSGH